MTEIAAARPDLENTTYRFTLADGSTVDLKGNEEVEYDGETHSAAKVPQSCRPQRNGLCSSIARVAARRSGQSARLTAASSAACPGPSLPPDSI